MKAICEGLLPGCFAFSSWGYIFTEVYQPEGQGTVGLQRESGVGWLRVSGFSQLAKTRVRSRTETKNRRTCKIQMGVSDWRYEENRRKTSCSRETGDCQGMSGVPKAGLDSFLHSRQHQQVMDGLGIHGSLIERHQGGTKIYFRGWAFSCCRRVEG